MQQLMSTVLGSTNVSTKNGTKETIQGDGDGMFSSMLAEANEKVDLKKSQEKQSYKSDESHASAVTGAETPPINKAVESDEPVIDCDDSDVSLIFSQIQFANDMRQSQQKETNGENLPLDGVDTISLPQLHGAEVSLDNIDLDKLAQLTGIDLRDLSTMSVEDMTTAMADLSLADLSQLLPADLYSKLTALVSEQQSDNAYDVPKESELRGLMQDKPIGDGIEDPIRDPVLAQSAATSSTNKPLGAESASNDVLQSARQSMGQSQVLNAQGQVTSGTDIKDSQSKLVGTQTQTQQIQTQPLFAQSSEVGDLAASQTDLNKQNSLNAVDNILGNKQTRFTPVSEVQTQALLKDAQLLVGDLPQSNVQKSADISASSDLFAAMEKGDPLSSSGIQTLSNLSNQTSSARSDVPQFTLSLRQGLEQQSQMQEMIQRFSPVMKQQLMTMVSQGIHQAEIRLDPAELGHMTIRIQVQGDQTQVQFHVAQQQTRDVLEQALPRLKELLADQGMQLTDSQISQGNSGQERRAGSEGEGASGDTLAQLDEIAAEDLPTGSNISTSYGSAIDYYA